MKNRHQEKRLISVTELARYLGLSPMTIRTKMKKGELPFEAKRLGEKLIRFDIRDVDRYIDGLPLI